MAALALIEALINALQAAGKLTDREVRDIVGNAVAALPKHNVTGDDTQKMLGRVQV
jgi:hypothetical protein